MECKGEISLIKNDSYLECPDSIMGLISGIERNHRSLGTSFESFIDKVGSVGPIIPTPSTNSLESKFNLYRLFHFGPVGFLSKFKVEILTRRRSSWMANEGESVVAIAVDRG